MNNWIDSIRGYLAFKSWARLALMMAALLGIIAAAFAGGWHLRGRMDARDAPHPIRGGGYFFINPLLECEQPEESSISSPAPPPFSEKDIGEFLDGMKEADKSLHEIALYYRDLNTGYWIGVNKDHKFSPASIRKIPLVMAWFKLSESVPGVLKQPLTYDGSFDYSDMQVFRPSQMIQKGATYTAEELVYRSLLYSDNNAAHLLFLNIPPEFLVHAYTDLGLEPAAFKFEAETMNVQSVASFFRVLFNASYNTRADSELMLGILSQAEFKAGLVAGLPQSARVAHKFGENTLGEQGQRKQLHDCGIVYHPMKPYVLCVMAEGEAFEQIPGAISSISRNIYARVTRSAMRANN